VTERFLRRWSRLKQGAEPPSPGPAVPSQQPPEHLALADLRRAWLTDPAIRDFVEVAENQWDFNDPAALPGFGPLPSGPAAEQAAARLLTALGEPSATPAVSIAAPRLDLPPRGHVDAVWLTAANREAAPPSGPAPRPARRRPRTGPHGSAMPTDA